MRRLPWLAVVALLGAGVLLLGTRATTEAQTVHTSSGCPNCHRLHGSTGSTLTNYTISEDLCLSCHTDGANPNAPSGVSTHLSPSYVPNDSAATCVRCHGHRGSTSNLALIRASIATPNSGARTVLFTSRGTDAVAGAWPSTLPGAGPVLNSFADGNTTYDGVCEACHTETTNHQNGTVLPDNSNHAHNAGLWCTRCHLHATGFAGGGPCAACHDAGGQGTTGPNNRRPIIPEMARTGHHVGSAYQDSDCRTCHDMSQHQQGTVRLKNQDDTTAVYALAGSPLTDSAVARTLTPFCLSCHDGSAAGRTKPFSDSVAVPALDTAAWRLASHQTEAPVVGCFGNGTFGCHATAHGSQKRKLLAPAETGAGVNNVAEEEGFCFNCHDLNGPAATNIQGEFQKGTNTSTQTFHHPVDDGQQFVGRSVECVDCHNPHQATSANKLEGATGIDLRGNPVTGRDIAQYETCLKCHGDTYVANRDINGDGVFDTSNKRRDFNDSASAYHPVQQRGRNQSSALQSQLLGGLTTSSTIKCGDCHNNERTRDSTGAASRSTEHPQGLHGSTIYPILRDSSDLRTGASGANPPLTKFNLCFRCHDRTKLATAATTGSSTNYYGGSVSRNLHQYHLVGINAGATCRTCHFNAHANQAAGNTMYRIVDGPTTSYISPPVGYKTRNVSFSPFVQPQTGNTRPIFQINVATRARSCTLICHGTIHDGGGDFTFTPPAAGDNDPLKYVPQD